MPRPPGRTFVNPLVADAVALARRRQAEEAAQQATAHADAQDPEEAVVVKKTGRSRWMDDEEEEEETAATQQHKWPRHADQARPPAPSAGMSMAERAQAEVEEFRRRQAELAAEDDAAVAAAAAAAPTGYLAASPLVSSPEEEAHIRREGASTPDLRAAGAADAPADAVAADLAELGGDSGDEGEASPAPGPRPPSPGDSGGYPEVEAYPEPPEATPSGDEDERREGGEAAPHPGGEEEGGAVEEEEDGNDGDGSLLRPPPAKRAASLLAECRSVEHYEKLNRISEGTYGVVYRARDRATGAICALKKVKLDKERDGFPLTSVREINILLALSHPSIVNVSEVVVGASLDAVFMVMEYGDHDLKGVMERRMAAPFSTAEVKCLLRQLLEGVAYLHANWVIHRDLKTSNILYTNKGQLKICDFGLARQYGEPLKPYTQLVVTLWYRAPELLLGARTYAAAVDVWSAGCIMAELLTRAPLFAAAGELAQLDAIFKTLGTPTPETWPGLDSLPNFKKFNFKGPARSALRARFPPPGPVFDGRPTLSEAGFDLLSGLLELCPERRLTAAEALEHPWFREQPTPKDPALMPTFPETNATLHTHTHH